MHIILLQYTQEWYVQWFVSNISKSDSIIWCFEGSYSLSFDEFIDSIWTIQKVYFTANPSWLYRNSNIYLWFYDWDSYYCAWFNLSDWWPAWLVDSLWFDWTSFSQVIDYRWWSSPLAGWNIEDWYEIWQNFYTNWQIVEWYEYLWLDIWYCYWWFPIDDIFEPNQTIDDFTWYQFWIGATVWDLYNLYSWAYSTPKQFFQQMLQAYTNWQINRFKTEPKALIMFVQQYVSWRDRGRLNVWFYDIWDYCNLKFDNVDLNAQYTWHNQTPINWYNQKQASDSNLWWFQYTWDNAFITIIWTWGSWNLTASEFFLKFDFKISKLIMNR